MSLDLIIRNAKLADGRCVDIGVSDGRIAALERRIEARGPEHDAGENAAQAERHTHRGSSGVDDPRGRRLRMDDQRPAEQTASDEHQVLQSELLDQPTGDRR